MLLDMGPYYTVVSRLVRQHTQTNTVKDFPRCGRPHVMSQREYRALHRLVRRMSFATSPVLKQTMVTKQTSVSKNSEEPFESAGLKSRSKRPMLSDRHQRLRLAQFLARHGLNLKTWRRIHWSDESRFMLHVTDRRMRVWRQKNTAYT